MKPFGFGLTGSGLGGIGGGSISGLGKLFVGTMTVCGAACGAPMTVCGCGAFAAPTGGGHHGGGGGLGLAKVTFIMSSTSMGCWQHGQMSEIDTWDGWMGIIAAGRCDAKWLVPKWIVPKWLWRCVVKDGC